MKSDAIAFGLAGIVFGLIAGWVIGTQQASTRSPVAAPAAAAAAPASGAAPGNTAPGARAAVLDETQVTALKSVAEREPANAKPRAELGNLYFDAERFDDAAKWYAEAFKLNAKDVDVSTDLGISYYYTNQPDKALQQFDTSLKIDAKHTKTLLNIGVVRAFAKQDLEGATAVWQQVVAIAPDSPEGQTAKRALDSLQSAHAGVGAATKKPGA